MDSEKTLSELKPNDTVWIVSRRFGFRAKKRYVKKVRKYKVRTKITLSDNSEWEGSGTPWMYDSRYSGPCLETWSTRLQGEIDQARRKKALQIVLELFDGLNEDQQRRIGEEAAQLVVEARLPGLTSDS